MKKIIVGIMGLLLAAGAANAANFTYSEVTTTTTQWSAGTSWDATPVSAADTILRFTGDLPADTYVVSNNDISGNFLLNRLNFTYNSLGSSPLPTVTISGNPLEFTGASATFNFSAAETGNLGLTVSNNLVLSSDLTVSTGTSSSAPDRIVRLDGTISGAGNLTFNWGAGSKAIFVLSNSSNSYAGDTRLTHSSHVSRTYLLRLGASEVIPDGAGKGDVYFSNGSEASGAVLELNGFNETVNGLSSNMSPHTSNVTAMLVRNSTSAATAATLTLGGNNASGTFYGAIQNGNASAVLNLTKIGSGTQVFANGGINYTGTTTISGGVLKIDYSQRSNTATTNPANYFSSVSDMILDGGTTFAIQGRRDGEAVSGGVSGTSGLRGLTIDNAVADKLTVGQNVTLTGSNGTLSTWIVTMDRGATTTTVSVNNRVSGYSATISSENAPATTSQALKSLTLSGAADSVATLDFGTSGNVTLTINSAPVQLNDGSKLRIANWNGTPLTGGGSDQLLFLGSPTDFTSVFDQTEVIFDGHPVGYVTIPGTGFYEVAAIPEPGTLGVVLGGLALLALRRRIRG